ncbi:hypothetical protein HMPREF9005_2429 [Actinomyces sp. oral taxon 178 str. F0338]|nr:hypothetical protein HMPREF9005_2429 [Actinomyces sp. oral taxon 178 str. F0338]
MDVGHTEVDCAHRSIIPQVAPSLAPCPAAPGGGGGAGPAPPRPPFSRVRPRKPV